MLQDPVQYGEHHSLHKKSWKSEEIQMNTTRVCSFLTVLNLDVAYLLTGTTDIVTSPQRLTIDLNCLLK